MSLSLYGLGSHWDLETMKNWLVPCQVLLRCSWLAWTWKVPQISWKIGMMELWYAQQITKFPAVARLVGGSPTPLNHMKVIWECDIPNCFWKTKTRSKPPTSYLLLIHPTLSSCLFCPKRLQLDLTRTNISESRPVLALPRALGRIGPVAEHLRPRFTHKELPVLNRPKGIGDIKSLCPMVCLN